MTKAGAGVGHVDFQRPKQTSATSAADRVHRKAENGAGDQAPDRSQLQQIIAGLSEGVILIEPDHTITYVNDAALLMHGVTRSTTSAGLLTSTATTSCCAIATTVPSSRASTPSTACRRRGLR